MIAASISAALLSVPANAQMQCGDAPKEVPNSVQKELKSDVDAKARLLPKIAGGELKAAIETSRTELHQEHKNLDQHQIDMYFLWVACQSFDKAGAKLSDWLKVRAALTPKEDVDVTSVEIHLRDIKKSDKKLIASIEKIVSESGFSTWNITFEADKDRHLKVEYWTDDSVKVINKARLLEAKVKQIPAFRDIVAKREHADDPRFEEPDKLGLWLIP